MNKDAIITDITDFYKGKRLGYRVETDKGTLFFETKKKRDCTQRAVSNSIEREIIGATLYGWHSEKFGVLSSEAKVYNVFLETSIGEVKLSLACNDYSLDNGSSPEGSEGIRIRVIWEERI